MKRTIRKRLCKRCAVAPCVGAWIETLNQRIMLVPLLRSPPAWGRGLKQAVFHAGGPVERSPPAWGRGLKRDEVRSHGGVGLVAPCVGAWIETQST